MNRIELSETERQAVMIMDETQLAAAVGALQSPTDEVRYKAFLGLQLRSRRTADVLLFWDTLADMLEDQNSYRRSLGGLLIAENVRWSDPERWDHIASSWLSHCHDPKFITCRQFILAIGTWLPYRPDYADRVRKVLKEIDTMTFKDSQRPLIEKDIAAILAKAEEL